MFAAVRRVAAASKRCFTGGAGNFAPMGETLPTVKLAVLGQGSRSAVAPTAITSRPSFPEQEHCSSGSGTAWRPSAWGWLWTTAAVATMTTAASGEDHPVLLRGRKQEHEDSWSGKMVALTGRLLSTSVTSTKGPRPYMEDEFFLSSDGSFLAVFDGHGGAQVSKYLRKNLFRHFMENLSSNGSDAYDVKTVEQALRAAYQAVDKYVTTQTSFYNEGSCAVSVTVHCDRQGKVSLISCNVGDSRAVLSRGGKAVDVTEDHKPDSPRELERIFRLGGMVTWEGLKSSHGLPIEGTGVYRVNGNLAVARAIGDADHRPWVSGEAEIRTIEINHETDQFVILASDGLWDVMSSEEAVQYVHSVMGGALEAGRKGGKEERASNEAGRKGGDEERASNEAGRKGGDEERASNEAGSGNGSGEMTVVNCAQTYAEDRGMIRAATMLRKEEMASYLTAEAMRRGSMDNTTVAIVWLQ